MAVSLEAITTVLRNFARGSAQVEPCYHSWVCQQKSRRRRVVGMVAGQLARRSWWRSRELGPLSWHELSPESRATLSGPNKWSKLGQWGKFRSTVREDALNTIAPHRFYGTCAPGKLCSGKLCSKPRCALPSCALMKDVLRPFLLSQVVLP